MDKEKKQKIIIAFFIIVVIILIILNIKFVLLEIWYRASAKKYVQSIYDKNKDTVFQISKIYTYNGADAFDNSNNLQNFNISQFSDFAIYIDNHKDIKELTEENTIKELYIDNFRITLPEKIGRVQDLYYKNPYNMGKYRKLDYDRIDDKLDFEILYKNDENKPEFYNKPVFYTDCSNPISFSYINDDIYTNYSVAKNSSISYDGRVLKDLGINLSDITPMISFTIHIKNNLNENFICNMNLKANLENSEGSIYSGYLIEIAENFGEKYKFFKL